MTALRLHNPRKEDFEQIAGLPPQPFVGPDAKQVGIGLQNMKMGVHRLFFIGVLIAQPHIPDQSPVPGRRLFVTVVYGVIGMVLDHPKKPYGLSERPLVPRSPGILAQAVYGESEGIELFFRVRRLTCSVYRPVNPAVGRIEEFVEQVVPGGCRRREVFRAP